MTHDEKIATADRLSKMGGFYEALGKALLLADNTNEERLINAFPILRMQYEAKLKVIYGGRYNHLLEGQVGRDGRSQHGDNR